MATVKTQVSGNKVEIRIEGRFDFNLHGEFRDAYRNIDGPAHEFTVNLANVEYLDSSALGMLLLLREHAGGDARRVRLLSCQPEVRNILQIANFHKLFDVTCRGEAGAQTA